MDIYGHRGAAGEAPENTIAGCLHALERGVHHVEIDLRLSADEQLVVIHDKTVNRTTNKRGQVARIDASELAKLDGRGDGPPWPNKAQTGVPTLQALMAATPRMKTYQLEVKPDSKPRMRRIADLLAQRFSTTAKAKKVIVTSSNKYLHEYLAEIGPHLDRGMVITRPSSVNALLDLNCSYCAIHWSGANPYLIRRLRKAGVHISVWTVNDPQIIKNLYRLKVDSIITDYPSMAVPLLGTLQR